MQPADMEPMLPTQYTRDLEERALVIAKASNRLAGQLPEQVRSSIGDLVRSMNCYYSNLIEGHNTHPRDIDRALADQYSKDPVKRSRQLEARAHIEVQQLIDYGRDPDLPVTSIEYLQWIHKEFCDRLPPDLLWVENRDSGEKLPVVPGEFRTVAVVVGRHVPPPPDLLNALMTRFEQAYDPQRLSGVQRIISIAASHHRLVWIHPFIDGNGRVARLASHAMLIREGIGSPLWSVARGLARQVEAYKTNLANADQPRLGDLDGRGALSDKALAAFCLFFLDACIDQVSYMESLLRPKELLRRIRLYAADEIDAGRIPKGALDLLVEAFNLGEFERGRASELTGYQERRARQILAELIQKKLLVPQGPRKPVVLGFPIDVVERWLPELYSVT